MAVKRETPSASAVAWRKFAMLARQCRQAQAAGDDELRALLIVRVRAAFETWATAEEAAK
jgi:hypothetical protein